MISKKEAKPLKYKELDGLSEQILAEHHDVLYTGYVNKTNAIQDALKNVDLSKANATYSDLRELKVEETFALNGVKLHEAYFDSMGGNNECSGNIKELIEADFGSIEKWAEEFQALGLASRGWVVLAYDWDEKKLHNFISDVHNHGGVWNCTPLVVLDVYEHAYMLDYGVKRKDYVDTFMKNLDWKEVNGWVAKYNLMENRKG